MDPLDQPTDFNGLATKDVPPGQNYAGIDALSDAVGVTHVEQPEELKKPVRPYKPPIREPRRPLLFWAFQTATL
jgi:hypothetical protein